MLKKSIVRSLLLSMMIIPWSVYGQQQAHYTQYMFNGLAINPAYAAVGEELSVSALARWQWAGLEGAPKTQTLSVKSPIQGKNIGVGLIVTRDQIAVTNQTGVYGAFSYKLAVGSGFLSLGLQGGVTTFNGDYADVYTISPDITFQDQVSEIMPNMGAGLFYYNSVFYAGLSAPMLMQNTVGNGELDIFTQKRHYFFTSGMVFNLSENIKAKPNVLVKMVDGSPISADYNINFLFQEVIWFGVSYRPPESINFLAELNLNQRFRIGYAYDYILEQSLRSAATSSHEIMLNYRINLRKNSVITPRYF